MAPGLTHLPAALKSALSGDRSKAITPTPAVNPSSRAAPRLMACVGEKGGDTVTLRLDHRLLVGRNGSDGSGETVDLDLNAYRAAVYGVSRLHAAMEYVDGELYVTDLGSTNGTRINGLLIEAQIPCRVRSGDELEFGRVHISVRIVFGAR
jgi:hypothetical protein